MSARAAGLCLLAFASAAGAAHADEQVKAPAPATQQALPTWYQALTSNEVLRVVLTVPGLGPLQALELSGLPPRPAGQATGKRQHKPFRARMYYDQSAAPAGFKAALKPGAKLPGLETPAATLEGVRVESVKPVAMPGGKPQAGHEVALVGLYAEGLTWK